MTSYRQCDSYGNDILQRYHPYRQSYTRKKRNVSLVKDKSISPSKGYAHPY